MWSFAYNILRGKQEGSYLWSPLILLASTLLIHGQHKAAEVPISIPVVFLDFSSHAMSIA